MPPQPTAAACGCASQDSCGADAAAGPSPPKQPHGAERMAHARWNGGSHRFQIDVDINVRHTFGSGAFLVDDASGAVVSLDASGSPREVLREGGSYLVYSGGSRELRKQAGVLQGQLRQSRDEVLKLRQRIDKLGSCMRDEIQYPRDGMMPAILSAAPTGRRLSFRLLVQQMLLASRTTAMRELTVSDTSLATASAQGAEENRDVAVEASPGSVLGGSGAGDGKGTAAAPSALSSTAHSSARHPEESAVVAQPQRQLRRQHPAQTVPVSPIGHIETPFVEKNGTPRQACVCPSVRSRLRLKLEAHDGLNASHALEGLGYFSHVWLLFLFDKNGNVAAKSKVRPPRLDGIKTGLFSTRTPHRPNAIGLSLVRLHAVEGDVLQLGGADLVDGTPILDVKPYVPFADTAKEATVAPWLAELPTPDLQVRFEDSARRQLRELVPQLALLRSEGQAVEAIEEVLSADPRSVHWRQSRTDIEFGFSIDKLNIVCRFVDGTATVTAVQHLHLSDRSHVPTSSSRASSMTGDEYSADSTHRSRFALTWRVAV